MGMFVKDTESGLGIIGSKRSIAKVGQLFQCDFPHAFIVFDKEN